jgi:hypothetical protein
MKLSHALFAVLLITSLGARAMGTQAPSERPVASLDLPMNSLGAPVFEVDLNWPTITSSEDLAQLAPARILKGPSND